MRRIRQDRAQAVPDAGKIFIGSVFRQNLVAQGDAPSLRVTAVTFEDGARNRWHHHSTEQVLVITHGEGIVANERESLLVTPGDVVLIPAGERHWHGAEAGRSMTHLSILVPGEMTIDD
jgi:quercetin dioxygenase-like cupin family protein